MGFTGFLLLVGFIVYIAAAIGNGYSRIPEVRESVGHFKFVQPDTATARLRSTKLYSWEFGFIDPDAYPDLGDSQVTVILVNHDSRPVVVSWKDLGPNAPVVVGSHEVTIPAKTPIRYWSGKYRAYRDERTDPWFTAEPHAVHDVEIVLSFEKPPAKVVDIKPVVYSTL